MDLNIEGLGGFILAYIASYEEADELPSVEAILSEAFDAFLAADDGRLLKMTKREFLLAVEAEATAAGYYKDVVPWSERDKDPATAISD